MHTISGSIQGIWDDLTNWKGFSQDPVGMILQKAAGIANKVLAIAGVITGILGVLTLAATVGSIFTLGGLAPLAAWLGGATITMGTITFWIGAIALGLNVLNGIKNIYDIHTAKTAEVLFKNSGELKSDITNSGMAILAIIGGKASQKGGASIKDLAKRNPKTFGKRMFINVKNGLKAKIVSIPRKITSVFKKETWMKWAQNFKAAYKKAQEWVTEPFRKKATTPSVKVKNSSEVTTRHSSPEQHAEFIDTPENLKGGERSKNTKLAEKEAPLNNIVEERDIFWKELKERYFPDNDWSKTDFVTEGVNFDKFKLDHPDLFDEMASKYNSIDDANKYIPGLVESGSTVPVKVMFKKGDELFKIVQKGGNIDSPSAYYLTKSELDFVKQHPESLEQALGLPLSSTTSEYDVFKIVAKKDNISGFESIIAQTKQSAKVNPGDFYKTTGGKKQTLIIDNKNSDIWEKGSTPVETISPKSLPKID